MSSCILSFKMEQKRLQDIENYLRRGEYPVVTVKKNKPNFRRCRNNYKSEGGILSYKKCSGKKTGTSLDQFPRASCVSGVRRKRRGSWSHAIGGVAGVTLGGIKPWRFVPGFIGVTWLIEEIREYVKKCPQCQRMYANFMKLNTKLHPIPVLLAYEH